MIDKQLLLEWLGISPDQCPPHHYQLLGIRVFESNTEAIRNAADRQYSHVKRMAVNEFTDMGQKLLDEIMAAKICLLNEAKRAAYDAKLRSELPAPTASPAKVEARSQVTEELTEYTLLIGADPQCEIHVNEHSVSSVHCKLVRQDQRVQVRDLASTNGTFVNARRIKKEMLSPTDLVTMGPSVMLIIPPKYLPRSFRDANLRIVGRSRQSHIRIDDVSVSNFHAKIYSDDGELVVEDLKSTNGTKLLFADAVPRPVENRAKIGEAQAILFGSKRIEVEQLARLS